MNVPTYVYRPEHPDADKLGFVDKSLANWDDYQAKEHLNMTVGNRKVTIRFNSDTMEPLQHMCSGKMISSKKKFRDETKAYGCIEVGNETKIKPRKQIVPDKRQRRDDIKKAIHELKNGRTV